MRMPAEWAPHERTIVCWPARETMWQERFADAKADHAAVVNAIAAFDPVTLAVDPSQEAEARAAVRGDVDVVAIPLDDSWSRDSGPIFVTGGGSRAGVHFGFNAWGEKFSPYDRDAAFGARVLEHLGEERVDAGDLILEGGSIAVDGEGTLITTEQCLLHPNRNPTMSRQEIEGGLRDYLGVEAIIWLGQGHSTDRDTDGHIDGIASYVAPAIVVLLAPDDPNDPDHQSGRDNLQRLRASLDAKGRGFEVIPFQTRPPGTVPYLNFYLPNGGVIAPVAGRPEDEQAVEQITKLFPEREVVPVPGNCLTYGGGGPHCITQQRPSGVPVPA